MLGGTLTLLNRSIRYDGKLLRAHLLRLLFTVIMFGALISAHVNSLTFGAPGLHFFEVIVILNFGLISLAGVSFFASAITEEKEDGTLGLLKMAGISPVAILLGKSTSRVMSCLLLLLVQFPFAVLSILLGGVTLYQIISAYVMLAAFMALAANVALLCSVYARRSGNASGLTLAFLGYYLTGAELARISVNGMLATGRIAKGGPVHEFANKWINAFDSISVWSQIDRIMETGFDGSMLSDQVVFSVIAAVVFFVTSCMTFNRFTRDEGAPVPQRGLISRSDAPVERRRPNRVWTQAIIWKDFNFVTGGLSFMIFKTIAYAASFGFIFYSGRGFQVFTGWSLGARKPSVVLISDIGTTLMAGSLIVSAIELCLYATRIFHDELKWKTLAVTMLIPLSRIRITYSKICGCLLALAPNLVFFFIGVVMSPGDFFGAFLEPATIAVLVLFVVFLHLTVLFSLFIKWGALPLAIAVIFVLDYLARSFFLIPFLLIETMTKTQEATMMPIVYFGCCTVAVLQFLIGERLQTVSQ